MSQGDRCMFGGPRLSHSLLVGAIACALGGSGAAVGEPIRRVRGIIDRDQTWTGHVIITDEVTVLGATLRVEAGTLVEFAVARPGAMPVLRIGEERGRPSMLRMASTSESPIVFRTRQGTQAGRIVAWLRPPRAATRPESGGAGAESPVSQSEVIRWHAVRFEDLGRAPESDASTRPVGTLPEAAVEVYLGTGAVFELANCEFSRSRRLSIQLDGGARATLANTRMTAPLEKTAVHLRSRGVAEPAFVHVVQNRAEAIIIAEGVAGLIGENVLIGPHATVVLRGSTKGERAVRGNYVHNTGPEDDGRYCFFSDDPEVVVEENIFRGGSNCVFMGTTQMMSNVLIGAPSLRSSLSIHSQTQRLVGALPPGARFENNLLIGPAYSMLVPQPLHSRTSNPATHSETIIRNNVFDGLDGISRGVHVSAVDRAPARVRVEDNLFLRVGAMIFDEAPRAESRLLAGHNACAPWSGGRPAGTDDPRAEGLRSPSPASTNVLRERIADLRLRAGLPDSIRDMDYLILEGRESIEQLRRRLFDGYRPLEGSPLIGAGSARHASGGRGNIGPDRFEPVNSGPE